MKEMTFAIFLLLIPFSALLFPVGGATAQNNKISFLGKK